eukprot:NODE_4831_length_1841_cov_2.969078.p1 GENE.NODE_4831_length_1841_cov_2.969078~~NODE_4831_length_1841_cov_2.969078.p1  ORF type:complete len:338 (-),score=101.42 NODE_4831_length_1841_cov_2.969078:247-1260(-)
MAAAAVPGGLRALFCRRTQQPGAPQAHFVLTLVELFNGGEALEIRPLVRLVGCARPLAAAIAGDHCLFVGNGPYREEGASDAAQAVPTRAVGEGDDDLHGRMASRGVAVAEPVGTHADAMLVNICAPSVVAQAHRAVAAGAAFIATLALGHHALAAEVTSDALALRVLLRTPDGHAAVVSCAGGDAPAAPNAEHIDTFPGLGLACDSPGFAYLLLSPRGRRAAAVRWRGGAGIELYEHAAGAASAATTTLRLPGDGKVRGAALEDDALCVWQDGGLVRYPFAGSDATPSAADVASAAEGIAVDDEWGPPPEAPTASGADDWGAPPPEAPAWVTWADS